MDERRRDPRTSKPFSLSNLLATRASEEGWLGGDLTLWGPAATEAQAAPPVSLGTLRWDAMHVIDLAAGPGAWSASLRKSATRTFGAAARRGVTIAEEPQALAQVYALYAEQARAWPGHRARPLAFYAALLEPPSPARLWVARLAGRAVAGILAFVDPVETYAWWSGAAAAARASRAYLATLAAIAEGCGSTRLNLGFSGHQRRLTDFKEQLGAVPLPVPIVEIAARPRSPWHALLGRARERARARRAARSETPAGAGREDA